MIAFFVRGLPIAQGSKDYVGNGKMIESAKGLKPWRSDVAAAAAAAMESAKELPFTRAVEMTAVFHFPRPKSHYGTGKNSNYLKPNAPKYKGSRPDVSKLVRAVEDAITGIVYVDDAQIASLAADKVFAERGGFLGVEITVEEI